jgi:hypothetical protein
LHRQPPVRLFVLPSARNGEKQVNVPMDYILVLLYTQFATTRCKIIMKFVFNIIEYAPTLDDWASTDRIQYDFWDI